MTSTTTTSTTSPILSLALSFSSTIQQLGPIYGPITYIFFLATWVVFCLPCSFIEMVPGFLFGVPVGALVSTIGKMIGSTISLFLARYVFKDAAQRYIDKNFPIIKKLSLAVEREGFPALLLIRSAMLPIAIKNYGLAVINVSIFHSLLAGFITSIPHSIMWAMVGAKASNLADVVSKGGSVMDALPSQEYLLVLLPVVGAGLYVGRSILQRFQLLIRETEEQQQLLDKPLHNTSNVRSSNNSSRKKGNKSKNPKVIVGNAVSNNNSNR
jgi:uncharacterized membrane protein YdjX (TVP38/TMEM64 family)